MNVLELGVSYFLLRLSTVKKTGCGLIEDESGVSSVEYGLIAFFVALAILGALIVIGATTGGWFESLSNEMQAAER